MIDLLADFLRGALWTCDYCGFMLLHAHRHGEALSAILATIAVLRHPAPPYADRITKYGSNLPAWKEGALALAITAAEA